MSSLLPQVRLWRNVSSPSHARLRRSVPLFLLVFSSPLVNPGAQVREVEFYRERVDIEVLNGKDAAYDIKVKGLYHFRTVSKLGVRWMVLYPFPIDEDSHYPHELHVAECPPGGESIPIPFMKHEKTAAFPVSVGPSSTSAVSVEYVQHLEKPRATYITTTITAWGKPLEAAEFSITLPKNYVLKEISYTPDRIYRGRGRIVYYFKIDNFFPDEDLIFSWEKQ